MNEALFAFTLTMLAGLFTCVGGLIILFCKKKNTDFLSICLSFSAGVMIYISFVEIFAKSFESLKYAHGEETGLLITTIAFFAGILIISATKKIFPHENETKTSLKECSAEIEIMPEGKKSLHRMGITTALAIAVHNFPEGLVTFVAALHDPALGVTIAIAIAIHNIPEGIAVAVPIYYSTGSKTKAILASAASGLTEPLGAIAAYFILIRFMFNESMFGVIFALAGGIMIYISFNQLLPTAQKYGEHHQVMKGLFTGVAVMALSLVIF